MPELITGRKPVIEALRSGAAIERIVLLPGVHGKPIEEIKALAARRRIAVVEAERHHFRELAHDQMTQGVVAVLQRRHTYASLETILERAATSGEKPFVLILDEIEDPQNLGALIRSAECAGVHGVIVPKHHSAPVNATVVKASAGATAHMPVAEVTNIVNTIEELKKKDFWITGLDGAAEKLYNTADYRTAIAIVVGNEGRGLRRLVKEHCDFLVRIPLYGKIQSLNASVAGALVMFEVARQRQSAA